MNSTLLLAYKGDEVFHVHWTGTTSDIVYDDGSKPDTSIDVSVDFFFENYQKWL